MGGAGGQCPRWAGLGWNRAGQMPEVCAGVWRVSCASKGGAAEWLHLHATVMAPPLPPTIILDLRSPHLRSSQTFPHPASLSPLLLDFMLLNQIAGIQGRQMGVRDRMNPALQTDDTAPYSISGKKIKSTGISEKPVWRGATGRVSYPNSVFCILPFQGSFTLFPSFLGSSNSLLLLLLFQRQR